MDILTGFRSPHGGTLMSTLRATGDVLTRLTTSDLSVTAASTEAAAQPMGERSAVDVLAGRDAVFARSATSLGLLD